MAYVDGYVLAVKTDRQEEYRALAAEVGAIFREHGAERVVECWGDEVPDGEVTSFGDAVKLEADETVVFSWIVWPSKDARDAGNEKVAADPRVQHEPAPGIMDARRMIYAGFVPIVDM